jgi:hypothetical protein
MSDIFDFESERKRRLQAAAEVEERAEDEHFEVVTFSMMQMMQMSGLSIPSTVTSTLVAIIDYLEEAGVDRAEAIKMLNDKAKLFGVRKVR